MSAMELIVDAHLDLAYNAVRGRAVTRPASEQAPDEEGVPTVGLPDLRAGGVKLICGTIFCEPAGAGPTGYRSAEEAHAAMHRQLSWYQQQRQTGNLQLVTRRDELQDVEGTPAPRMILLLEGADPIRNVEDVPLLVALGVRIVGLAWRRTRYAGGTGAPGPLTPEGIELVDALDRAGVIHDASHLAEASFWQLLERSDGRVIATHSNCRSIVPTDRQLSDAMIRAIIERDGVIGINFYDRFLLPPDEQGKRRATLADVVRHVRHICDLSGDARHVGLGTDMDGGLGREQIPVEIRSSADLPKLGEALRSAGFADDDIRGILGGNWVRFFSRALPT